jgi:gliding motility-associated-like protein
MLLKIKNIGILLSVFILINSVKVNAQLNQGNCPNNIDFELGDFTNWNLYTGVANNVNAMGQIFSPNTQFAVYSAANGTGINDQFGNFPVLCPNGSNYSVLLGRPYNGGNAGGQSERLSYTFTIPAGFVKYSLTYFYAAVLNQGGSGHNSFNQPRFSVKIIDINTNQQVGCSTYDYNSNDGATNGFVQSGLTGTGNTAVFYKNWTPVTVDLSGLNGLTLKLEFTTNDCHPGAHFGYAYIDVGATCITPVTGYAYCQGADNVTLTAPFGYQNYIWYDQTYTLQLGNSQTLTISPPPPNGTIYNIDLIPTPFGGCRDTLPVTIEEQIPPDTPVAQTFYAYCLNQASTQLTATNLPGYILQWYTTSFGGTPNTTAPTPSTSTVGSTDYWVSQLSFGGCEGPRKKITVTVADPSTVDFSINDDTQCIGGNVFTFTNNSTNLSGGTVYSWNFGDGSPLVTTKDATHNYTVVGTYNVTLTVTNGTCSSNKIIPVSVTPSPIADFTFTNTCLGNTIDFTNTTTGSSASTQYTWVVNATDTFASTNMAYLFATSGVHTVTLLVADGGCSSALVKQVNVFAVPKPNISFTTACEGDTIQFTDLSTISTGVITSWNWDFGGGNTSTLKNPKMAFSTYGPQTIKLSVSSANCSKDSTFPITIHEKPIAKLDRIDSACINQLVQLRDASYFTSGASKTDITSHWWQTNGVNYSSNNISPTYTSSSNFTVKQVVKSVQGCISDTNTVVVNVKPLPIAKLKVLSNLCENRDLQFEDISAPYIQGRLWQFSNGFTDNNRITTIHNLNAGSQSVRLIVTDSNACISAPFDTSLVVFKRPRFDFEYLDSCVERPVTFKAFDANANYISEWYWNFEGQTYNGFIQQSYQFAKSGINNLYAYAKAPNGCVSDTVYHTINLHNAIADAGKDIITTANQPTQLNASGGVQYYWSPFTGLNDVNLQNPIATNAVDRLYKVKVTDVFGCYSYDDVLVKIYKGNDVYIPTIFTPNNDGVNDVLQLTPVGIKEFKFITIYDRYGKLVFQSNTINKSWDGRVKGKFAQSETFIYIIEAVDIDGKLLKKKGTVVLAR